LCIRKLKKSYYKISYRHHGAYNETKFDYLRHGLAFCKKEQKDRVKKKKKKLFASVAEASSTTGTQKAERAELKVNDGGVPMYV